MPTVKRTQENRILEKNWETYFLVSQLRVKLKCGTDLS